MDLATSYRAPSQGIERQTTGGGGIGRYLKNTNLVRISVLAGFAGQNTEYQQNIATQNLASGLIAANLQFFRFNKTNATVTTVFLPVISQPGRVKFNLNCDLLRQNHRQSLVECLVLRQLGQPAAEWSFQQRLRLQFGTQLDIWQQVTEVWCATRASSDLCVPT